MKKKKISDLFYDNRFLFVFSLVVAIGFWLVAVVEFGVETTNTIKNIPVQIDYAKVEENFGLKPFGETAFTVDVKISGKKYIIDADNISDDIVVTAASGFVSSPGTQTLKLDIATKSVRPAYDIVEFSSDEVEVYFDYPKEKEFLVEADIDLSGATITDEYYLGDFIFQEPNKVRISGPETEVNRIEKVLASAEITDALHENISINTELKVLTKDGLTPKYITFNRQSENMQITLPVYKIATLPVDCSFINIPSDYINNFPFSVTVEPSTATFGIPEKKLEGITSIEIDSIDFSDIHSGINTFTVPASDISGVIMLDKTESFTVTVDAGDMILSTVEVPDTLTFNNVPSGVNVELINLNFTHMSVYGPQSSIDLVTKENLILNADLRGIDKNAAGEVEVPVTFSNKDCWSYGEYTAKVLIS